MAQRFHREPTKALRREKQGSIWKGAPWSCSHLPWVSPVTSCISDIWGWFGLSYHHRAGVNWAFPLLFQGCSHPRNVWFFFFFGLKSNSLEFFKYPSDIEGKVSGCWDSPLTSCTYLQGQFSVWEMPAAPKHNLQTSHSITPACGIYMGVYSHSCEV